MRETQNGTEKETKMGIVSGTDIERERERERERGLQRKREWNGARNRDKKQSGTQRHRERN